MRSALLCAIVLTADEIRGLTAGLLVSHQPALGRASLLEWLKENASTLGRAYANELDRHFGRRCRSCAGSGLLNPLDGSPPGSVWWRAMRNERLLRDGCEAIALVGGLPGEPSSQAVRLWLEFVATPRPSYWYRAHNASFVAGYLEHEGLAEEESAPERFFMNVALARVLYAHALVADPRLALGRLAGLARMLGDPRLGMAGAFLSLRRVVPNRYPLPRDVEWYIADEQRLGRMLDYAVIVPRLQRLYEWSAEELAESRLLELVRDGNPIYAWPFEERHAWRSPHMRFAARVLERVTRAR
jgi:hypothetical protein